VGTRTADLILRSGRIHTLDARDRVVRALATRGGRIVEVGRDADVLRWRGSRTEVVDLEGRFACPGFIDCHTHFAKRALGITRVDLHGAASLGELLARLKRQRRRTPRGEWVLGRGWDESTWDEKRFPTREDLDAAVPDRPVKASRVDGHSCVVNTLGWETLGIPKDFPGVVLDAAGRPTGVLKEHAYEETLDRIVDPPERYREALPRMEREAQRLGVTTVCDFVDPKDMAAYTERRRAGRLRVRVVAAMWVRHLEAMELAGMHAGIGDEWLKVQGVKMYGDGSIGSRTAAMRRPYRDDPGNRGQMNMGADEMVETVARARVMGLQVCVHAIGDRGVEEVIGAYERAAKAATLATFRGERHRVEHCELVTKDGIRRMKRLGLVASMQPNFVGQWSRKGALYDQRIGGRWHGRDNPMRWLLDGGVPVVFGSDNMPFGPLYGIASAVGAPSAAQRLTPREALAAYTRDAAWALREEASRGTLEVGKLADVVVLDGDPLRRSERLDRIGPWATVVGGRMPFKQRG